jgi:hypothetical protein
MIDIDKYEGHTPAPWQRRGMLFHPEYEDAIIPYIEGDAGRLHGDVFLLSAKEMIPNVSGDEVLANITLIADAPLLLEEVKRLREKLNLIRNTVYYDIEENFTEKQAHNPEIIDIMKKIHEVIE